MTDVSQFLYFMQEHFVENAKLSENYFIVDCEVMLVCLSTE